MGQSFSQPKIDKTYYKQSNFFTRRPFMVGITLYPQVKGYQKNIQIVAERISY